MKSEERAANERVKRVFEELKAKGAIHGNRRLKAKRGGYPLGVENFKASLFFHVLYHRSGIVLEEDEIAFSLLHEEAHKTLRQNTPVFFALLCILAAVLSVPYWYHYFTGDLLMGISVSQTDFVFFVVFCFIFMKAYSDRFHEDEYDADTFAGRKIRELDYSRSPEEILESTLNSLKGKMKVNEDSLSYRVTKFLLAGVFHPSVEDRVEHLGRELGHGKKV